MAKNNKNKGFSLTEIIIAIAILSLLLIPIINQFTGTMRMNRRSKEQQKANENAQFVLEYFKDTDIAKLKAISASGDIQTTGFTQYEYDPKTLANADADDDKPGILCNIYVAEDDGTGSLVVNDMPIGTINYSAMKFDLNDAYIGSRRTQYSRTVYMDDLSAQLKATEITVGGSTDTYRIAYGLPESLVTPEVNEAGVAKYFKRTNEGSYVLYDEDGMFVRGIVCVKSDMAAIANPNLANGGNVHDLDSEGVALITGFATDFDSQACNELYAKAMENLRINNKDLWDIEMFRQDDSSYLDKFFATVKKLLVIHISEGSDAASSTYTKYYEVSVDVVYDSDFGSDPAKADKHSCVTYNAYSQKFYYDPSDPEHKIPNVYLEYQPFTVDAENGVGVEYATDDYILIDNQINGGEEDIKVYLVKPKWDYAHRFMSSGKAYDDEEYMRSYATSTEYNNFINAATDYEKTAIVKAVEDRNKIYYKSNEFGDINHNTNTQKVSIHLNYTSDSYPVKLITNMDNTDVDVANAQFVSANTDDYNDVPDTHTAYFVVNGTGFNVRAFDLDNDAFISMEDEENKEDRYLTVSVHMAPVDEPMSNNIVLNGAKGEN